MLCELKYLSVLLVALRLDRPLEGLNLVEEHEGVVRCRGVEGACWRGWCGRDDDVWVDVVVEGSERLSHGGCLG